MHIICIDHGARPVVALPSNIIATQTIKNGIKIWRIAGVTEDQEDEIDVEPIVNPTAKSIKLAASANPERIKLVSTSTSLYTKFDGNESGVVTIADLMKNIELEEGWTNIAVTKNGETLTYSREEIEQNSDNISLENATNISICYENETITYEIYQVGNVYTGDDYDNAININDVIFLRRAIIGDEEAMKDENYVEENANTNLLEDEYSEADVSDVILIRQKILTGEWIDIED